MVEIRPSKTKTNLLGVIAVARVCSFVAFFSCQTPKGSKSCLPRSRRLGCFSKRRIVATRIKTTFLKSYRTPWELACAASTANDRGDCKSSGTEPKNSPLLVVRQIRRRFGSDWGVFIPLSGLPNRRRSLLSSTWGRYSAWTGSGGC